MARRDATDRRFKARAGALTLLYIVSPMERDVLLTMLAEANTGLELQEIEPPDIEYLTLGIFRDRYLLEPADPDHPPGAPIDEDTLLQPTAAGLEVPIVAAVLERWLNRCPGSSSLAGDPGPLIGALLCGWSSMVVHALAGGPLSAAQIQEAIQTLGLDPVEQHLGAMVETELLERLPGGLGAEPLYKPTKCLRQAIAPLVAAARMEHRHPPGDTAPLSALDVAAIFQLALPLLKLPRKLSGTCALAVELDDGVPDSPAEVTALFEEGRLVSCGPRLEEEVDARVTGSVADWLDTLLERRVERVRSEGDVKLARRLVRELKKTVFS